MQARLLLNQVVETSVKIQCSDTDCMNIVWHGSYLRFLERGREDYIESIGQLRQQLEQSRLYLAMKSIKIEYIYPARLYEVLTVKTWVTAVSRVTMDIAHEIHHGDKQILSAAVEGVCISHDGKAHVIPVWMRP